MKLVLLGTSSWVLPAFVRVADEHEIVAVFTRAPAPVGRKQIITKSPVHAFAEARGIPVETNINEIHKYNADMALVASYGVIIKDDILARFPFVNIHPSALPKYRGPSPMLTAIYNGDTGSAVCLMRVAHDVDAGDILMRREFAIGANDTIRDVENTVAKISADMVAQYFAAPENFAAAPQTGAPTYTKKFTGADEIIDWKKSPLEIHNQIRSIGGRAKINGIDVKVLETKIADGKLEILRVQPAGKRPMDWRDFVNGQRGVINFDTI